jgi:hypothetical protein
LLFLLIVIQIDGLVLLLELGILKGVGATMDVLIVLVHRHILVTSLVISRAWVRVPRDLAPV